MTIKECRFFRSEVDKIRDHLPHPIAKVNISKIGWKKMREGNMGKYSRLKKKIFLSESFRDYPEGIISTLARELHRMWQHQTYGPLYYIMCLPLLRGRMLERTAIEVENKADALAGNAGIRDGDKGSGLI